MPGPRCIGRFPEIATRAIAAETRGNSPRAIADADTGNRDPVTTNTISWKFDNQSLLVSSYELTITEDCLKSQSFPHQGDEFLI